MYLEPVQQTRAPWLESLHSSRILWPVLVSVKSWSLLYQICWQPGKGLTYNTAPQVGFNTRSLCTAIVLLGPLKLVSEQFSDVDNLHYGHRGPAANLQLYWQRGGTCAKILPNSNPPTAYLNGKHKMPCKVIKPGIKNMAFMCWKTVCLSENWHHSLVDDIKKHGVTVDLMLPNNCYYI